MKSIRGIIKIISLLLVLSASVDLYSQDLQSAYFVDSYLYSYRLNPAFQPSKNFIGALAGNIHAGTHSNVGVSTFFYPDEDGHLKTFLHPSIEREEFLSKLQKTNRIMLNLNYNIASVGYWTEYYKRPAYQTFELNLRNNTSARLPYNLFSFLKNGSGKNFEYDLSNVYAYTNTFLEFASGTSIKFGNLQLGARGKLLIGLQKINLRVREMFAVLSGEFWNLHSTADVTAAGGIKNKMQQGAWGYYEVIDLKNIKINSLGLGGVGAAIDLGFKYKINDFLNISGSLNDFGVIVWKNNVKGYNDGRSWIFSDSSIEFDGIGSIGTVVNNAINSIKSAYEFLPDNENKISYQSLSYTANLGVEFILPFYKKISLGVLGTFVSGRVFSYKEIRASLNVKPLKWFSASLSCATTSLGLEWGGMVNINLDRFSFFIGTDSYYYKMTRQFIPVDEFNTQIVVGFNYIIKKNPFARR